MLTFSLSALQAWQRCEQKYAYGYVRKLRPAVRDVAPERGSILHEYLATYYSALRDGVPPMQAHEAGHTVIMAKLGALRASAAVAFYAGLEERAQAYLDMVPVCVGIAERYFNTRGEDDAERYEVLLVEERIRAVLVAGIESKSIVDLVLRDRNTGYVWLVEHKSTRAVPESDVRLRDFQTLLYAEVLERTGRIPQVDGVLWNYLRTKEPDIPHQNKDGRFSRAISIDTTWPVFSRAVIAAGQNVEQYADVKERLIDREEVAFFPRYEHVIVADPGLLLQDYVAEAQRVRWARQTWTWGTARPVRTLARDCTFCEFYRICEAAITGGDEEDVIRMKFVQEGAREQEEEVS